MFWINRSLHFHTVQPDSSHRVHVCRLKTWGLTTRNSTFKACLLHFDKQWRNHRITTIMSLSSFSLRIIIIAFQHEYSNIKLPLVELNPTSILMFSQLTAQVLSHLQQLLPSYRISKIQDHLQDSIHRNLRRWLTDVVQILVAQRNSTQPKHNDQRNARNILPRTTLDFFCMCMCGFFQPHGASWWVDFSKTAGL